jgi:NAD(P)-dependent dehydrogenase (short-subunit alcohol dehydrogenase family)
VWGYISRSSDAERAVAAAINRFGGVDVLVNNAGIQSFGDVLTTSEDTWGRTFGVKLKGHWLMSRSTVPEMLKRGKGAIVNVSSVQGLACQRNVLAYATSQHAMIGFTRPMAIDLAARHPYQRCLPGNCRYTDDPVAPSVRTQNRNAWSGP